MAQDLFTTSDRKIVRLTKKNSVDFVRNAFALYRNQELFMIDSDGDQSNAVDFSCDIKSIEPLAGGGWLEDSLQPIFSKEPAQIIFSSGTEGKPKAIAISHSALANVVERINGAMHVDSSIREYIGVPVTFSFGLARCRAIAAAGGKGFIPENGFSLNQIIEMLKSDKINAISAVPSLWRIVLDNKELFGNYGEKVKWIEIGSQYMSADEKRQMKLLFPNAQIVQHYGLTEASRTTLLSISNERDEYLESVGPAVSDSVEIKIDSEHRIMIKGPHIALGNIVDDQLIPLTDSDGWITTSDTGKVVDGMLYYTGRHDDIINCGGLKIDPENLQQKVNSALGGAYKVAITGIPDKNRGEAFFVAIESAQDLDQLRNIVNLALSSIGISANDAVKIQQVTSFPTTPTGKIQRKQLAKLYVEENVSKTNVQDKSSLLDAYKSIFNNHLITSDASFESLGGDSLNYVQLSATIEKLLGHLPDDWEKMTIDVLQASTKKPSKVWSSIEPSVLLRSIAILFIVASHSGLTVIGGGTHLLFMLIGVNLARFQRQALCRFPAWSVLCKYAFKILIPYYVISVAFAIWMRKIDPGVFFLYQNFYTVHWHIVFPSWLVQVLMQSLLVIGILFSLAKFRDSMSNHAWPTSYILLLLAMIVGLLTPYTVDTTREFVLRYFPILWLGWTLHTSKTAAQKIITVLTGILFTLIDEGLANKSYWLIFGLLALPFVSRVILPRAVIWFVNIVAAATFYIFIFNGTPIYVLEEIFSIYSIPLKIISAVIFSIAMWIFFEKLNLPMRFFQLMRALISSQKNG